ncbi:MAG: DUF4254 domain-containing protein, partial [Planctomycetota bacterium]
MTAREPNEFLPRIGDIAELQTRWVDHWHETSPVAKPDTSSDLDGLVENQHRFNFLLWHEEDRARIPDADDATIANVKRSIDRLNQQRNDAIEAIDDAIETCLIHAGVAVTSDTLPHTESLGSVIDRLSILALRQYHLREEIQRRRPIADPDPCQSVPIETSDDDDWINQKLQLCVTQRHWLIQSGQQLADDLTNGRRRHVTTRSLKLYNDPKL